MTGGVAAVHYEPCDDGSGEFTFTLPGIDGVAITVAVPPLPVGTRQMNAMIALIDHLGPLMADALERVLTPTAQDAGDGQ